MSDKENITLQYALAYKERGWFPIYIQKGEKAPSIIDGKKRAWKKIIKQDGSEATIEEVRKAHINRIQKHPGCNVGISLPESGNLVDVDIDCPEALDYCDEWLPDTPAIFGRKGAPASHRLFSCSAIDKALRWIDPLVEKGKGYGKDHVTIVEILKSGQTVFPPSIHKGTGEQIAWQNGETEKNLPALATVSRDELVQAINKIAMAVLLERYWNANFHDGMLALAGGLARSGWPLSEAQAFIKVVGPRCGMDDISDRLSVLKSTYEKYEADEQCTGWPSFEEYLGEEVVGKLRLWANRKGNEFMDDEASNFLEELLANCCLMKTAGGSKVIDIRREIDTAVVSLGSFRDGHAGKTIKVDKKTKQLVDVWLEEISRKEVTKEIYRPIPQRLIPVEGQAGVYYHNVYQPPTLQPLEGEGYMQPFLEHMEYLFPQEDRRDFMLDIFAHYIQRPEVRLDFVPLIISKSHGMGKSWIETLLRPMLGVENMSKTSIENLIDPTKFNEFLFGTRLCFVHEVYANGKRFGVTENLKSIITEDYAEVNIKNGFKGTTQIYTNLFFLSNHLDAMILDEEDRRFWIHEVTAPKRAKNDPFLPIVWRWVKGIGADKGKGLRQTYNFLQNREIILFDHAQCPDTREKAYMVDVCQNEEMDFVQYLMNSSDHPVQVATYKQVAELFHAFHERDAKEGSLKAALRKHATKYHTGSKEDKMKWNHSRSPVAAWILRNKSTFRNADRRMIRGELDATKTYIPKVDESDFDDHGASEGEGSRDNGKTAIDALTQRH